VTYALIERKGETGMVKSVLWVATVTVVTGIVIVPLKSQTAVGDAPAWQIAAGGRMSFEVAAVKPSKLPRPPNFPLDSRNAYVPGGRFSAGFPLWTYISFAYKLGPNQEEQRAAIAQFPKGLSTEFFEIDARAGNSTTKDQMRLMMQSLLADRFKLAVHFETREVPVLALTLVKLGKTGPKLHAHAEGPPCPEPGGPPNADDVFPPTCGTASGRFTPDGMALAGSRDSSASSLAELIYSYGVMAGEVDKPIIDQTGLEGTFDFTIQWNGRMSGPPPGADAPPPPDPQGTTFLQAVREQLGLKLSSTKGSVRMLVVDHVEAPSED
jgi:uncharacterized protein (TIGR03435 family)